MKKVLSFVLVLTLVLGSFSMVFAAPAQKNLSDIAGDANEQAIQVVNDLGIVEGYTDGTFKSGNNVTRAEFAAMITRALAIPESALAGYTSTSFKDAAGYGWAVKYLGFCESRGIMIGDGNGNAMPGRTVTVNEAMTMVLRAVGYTNNSSVLVGSWPANYVSLGQTLGLYDDVATAVTINRGSAAQVIYNALPVALVQVATDGTTSKIVAERDEDDNPIYRTLLTAGLNCTQEKGVIDFNDNSVIALAEYVGAYANIYRNSDDEIVAVDPISTFLTGSLDEGEFTADDVDYKFATGKDAVDLEEAVAKYTNADSDGTTTLGAITDSDITIAVDLSGKTIKEIYSVAVWTTDNKALADDDVQDEINDDQKLLGKEFDLDDDDDIDATSYSLLGVNSLSDIKEDNVLYVYTLGNKDNGKIVKIEVGTATVEGKVTRRAADKDGVDGYVYTIDGKKLYLANEDVAAPVVGDEGKALLDYNGDIYDWDVNDSKSENYAVVTGAMKDYGRDNMLMLLDKEGNEKDYVLKDDDVEKVASNAAVGDIVTFSLDKNGKIDDLEIATTKDDVTGKVSKDGSLIGRTVIKKSVVVFVQDDDDYSVGKIADIDTDKSFQAGDLTVVYDGSEVAVILVQDGDTGNSDDQYGIIKVNDIAGEDADGDDATLFDVIVDGKLMEDVVTELNSKDAAVTGMTDQLVKIFINADGVITKVEEHGLKAEDNEYVAANDNIVTKISGRVITVAADKDADGEAFRIADDAVIYVWNTDDEEWQVKTSLSSLRNLHVSLYDTDDDTTGFDVVMAY
ncbi:MAG: S-layer homology domain-containing protein [Firmicutes bacterium]|nr:S-layer homology domain-containing protein [Bacillota bacterium]